MVASVFFIQALLALTIAAPINDSVKVNQDGEILLKDNGSVILRDAKDENQAEQLLTHAVSPDDVNVGIHGLLKLGERPHEMEQEIPPCVPVGPAGPSGPHGPVPPSVGPIPAGGNHHHHHQQAPHHHNHGEAPVENEEPHSPSPASPCPPCPPPAPSSKPKCEHRVPFQQGEYALYLDTPCSECPRESTQHTEPHHHYIETQPQPQPMPQPMPMPQQPHLQPQQPCPLPPAPPSWPMPPHQMAPHQPQYGHHHEGVPYMPATPPPHHPTNPFEFGHHDQRSMSAPPYSFEFGHHGSHVPMGAPAHYDYGHTAPHYSFDIGRHEPHPQMISGPAGHGMEAEHPSYTHHPSIADLFRPESHPEHEFWSQFRNAAPYGGSHEAARAPRGSVAHPFAPSFSHSAPVEYVSPEVAVPGYIPPVVKVPAHGMEAERAPPMGAYSAQEPMAYNPAAVAAAGANGAQYPAVATVKKPSPHELHRRAVAEYPAQSYSSSNRGYVQEVPVCETRNGGVQYSTPASCNTCEEPFITVAQVNCNECPDGAEPLTDIYGNIGCYAQIGNQLAADGGKLFRHVCCPWSFFATNCDTYGNGACGTTGVNCEDNICNTGNCETTVCLENQCNPCETCPQGYYLNNGVCYPQDCQTEIVQEVPICNQKVNQPCYQQQTIVRPYYTQRGQVCNGPVCQQGNCQPRVVHQQTVCQQGNCQPRYVQQEVVYHHQPQQVVCQQGNCQPRFVQQQQGVCQQGNCQPICEQTVCEPLCEKPCEPVCEQPCEQVVNNNCNGNRPANNYDQQLECYDDVGNGVAEESGRCIRWLLCPWSWFGDNFDNGVAKARAAHRHR